MITYAIVGRLIRDAEIVTNKSGNSCEKFTLAVNMGKDKSRLYTCYYSAAIATKLHPWLVKGRQVMVAGSPNFSTGKDGKEYENVYVNSIELCGKKEETEELKTPPADYKQPSPDGLNGPESWEDEDTIPW